MTASLFKSQSGAISPRNCKNSYARLSLIVQTNGPQSKSWCSPGSCLITELAFLTSTTSRSPSIMMRKLTAKDCTSQTYSRKSFTAKSISTSKKWAHCVVLMTILPKKPSFFKIKRTQAAEVTRILLANTLYLKRSLGKCWSSTLSQLKRVVY